MVMRREEMPSLDSNFYIVIEKKTVEVFFEKHLNSDELGDAMFFPLKSKAIDFAKEQAKRTQRTQHIFIVSRCGNVIPQEPTVTEFS